MTCPFTPLPEQSRCCAATFQGYYCARCPYWRVKGSDVCEAHGDLEAQGRRVRRVKRPAVEARGA